MYPICRECIEFSQIELTLFPFLCHPFSGTPFKGMQFVSFQHQQSMTDLITVPRLSTSQLTTFDMQFYMHGL